MSEESTQQPAGVVVENKKPWQSKTVLFNILVAVAGIMSAFGFLPQVQGFLQSHADLVLGGIGAVGIALRALTKGAISIE